MERISLRSPTKEFRDHAVGGGEFDVRSILLNILDLIENVLCLVYFLPSFPAGMVFLVIIVTDYLKAFIEMSFVSIRFDKPELSKCMICMNYTSYFGYRVLRVVIEFVQALLFSWLCGFNKIAVISLFILSFLQCLSRLLFGGSSIEFVLHNYEMLIGDLEVFVISLVSTYDELWFQLIMALSIYIAATQVGKCKAYFILSFYLLVIVMGITGMVSEYLASQVESLTLTFVVLLLVTFQGYKLQGTSKKNTYRQL